MQRFYCFLIVLLVFQLAFISAWASKEDCGEPPNVPPIPIKEVNNEVFNVLNDYDEVVEESTGNGFIYLTAINGDQPKPNACGLNPSGGTLAGWGGPLNADNMTIGEGAGSRNDIVIGGTYFERGIGSHSIATFIYDLTGAKYVKFEGYVGMSDEKDVGGGGADSCGQDGTGDFIFDVDGTEMFASETLAGTTGGENTEAVKVEFDIPAGAKELTITFGDGGDGNGCDHSAMGDAKLMTSAAGAVEPGAKVTTLWGGLKASY